MKTKGKVLDCEMEISCVNNELSVTISIGMFFSKTVDWTRVVE
jgi:hypothetical protein